MSKKGRKSKALTVNPKTGMTTNQELGLQNILNNAESRDFLAHLLRELEFFDIVSDISMLPAQAIGQGLVGSMITIDREAAVRFVADYFMKPGGEDGTGNRDTGNADDGDGNTDGDDGNRGLLGGVGEPG